MADIAERESAARATVNHVADLLSNQVYIKQNDGSFKAYVFQQVKDDSYAVEGHDCLTPDSMAKTEDGRTLLCIDPEKQWKIVASPTAQNEQEKAER